MLNLGTTRSRRVEFFGRTATGLVPASVQLRSFGLGDVTITEAMPFPEATSSALGQWVELHNNQELALDFENLLVDSTGSTADGGYVIPAGTIVPAGGYLVIGQSLDMTDTGGAPVTQVATDLPLGSVDRLRVQLEGTLLSQLSWDAGTPGASINRPEPLLLASGTTSPCNRMATFGSAGAIGTPGAENEHCAPYILTSIASAFSPAPAGTEVFASLSGDEGYGSDNLPAPFTYFGTSYTTFSLSNNGFITLGFTLTSASLTNGTTASTSTPNGVLAPFWDDLERDTGKNAMWRQGNRTIISFESYHPYGSTHAGTSLNFQIHLVDTGVIEFHYGDISATSTTQSTIDRAFGNSATVWIESPDGTQVVPHMINQLNGVVPFSGLRFTPVP
jgi:hypothetical protein